MSQEQQPNQPNIKDLLKASIEQQKNVIKVLENAYSFGKYSAKHATAIVYAEAVLHDLNKQLHKLADEGK